MLKPAAVIFDLDGVLWHSSDAHARSFVQAFDEFGVRLPAQAYTLVAGMKTEAAVMRLNELFAGSQLDHRQTAALARRKQALAALWLATQISPDPEAAVMLQELQMAGYKLALATSASRATVQVFLKHLPVCFAFDAVVCGDDAQQGKPSPDLFLLAAQRVFVQPSVCWVVEDSAVGIQAARAAGMSVIAYRYPQALPGNHIIAQCERLSQVTETLLRVAP